MAVKILEPNPGNPTRAEWERLHHRTRLQGKGFMLLSLVNMNTIGEPKVMAGSRFEIDGRFYAVTEDEAVIGTCTSNVWNFIYAVPSGKKVGFIYDTVKPVFNVQRSGWMNGDNRAVAKFMFDGNGGYWNKVVLDKQKRMYEHNPNTLPTFGGVEISLNVPVNVIFELNFNPGAYYAEIQGGRGGQGGQGGHGGRGACSTGWDDNVMSDGTPGIQGNSGSYGDSGIGCPFMFDKRDSVMAFLGGDGVDGNTGGNGTDGTADYTGYLSGAQICTGGGGGGGGSGKNGRLTFVYVKGLMFYKHGGRGGLGGPGGYGGTYSNSLASGGSPGMGGERPAQDNYVFTSPSQDKISNNGNDGESGRNGQAGSNVGAGFGFGGGTWIVGTGGSPGTGGKPKPLNIFNIHTRAGFKGTSSGKIKFYKLPNAA